MTAITQARRTHRIEGVIVGTFLLAVAIGFIIRVRNGPFESQFPFAARAKVAPVTTIDNLRRHHEEPLLALDAVTVNGKSFPGNAAEVIPVKGTDDVRVSGWGADRVAGAPANAIFLAVGSQKPILLEYGSSRPDVAQALGNPQLITTGFAGKVPRSSLVPGNISLGFLVVDSSGLTYDVVPSLVTLAVK